MNRKLKENAESSSNQSDSDQDSFKTDSDFEDKYEEEKQPNNNHAFATRPPQANGKRKQHKPIVTSRPGVVSTV